MSQTTKVTEIPKWDGKEQTFDLFKSKVESTAALRGIGDALIETKMRDLPTLQQYTSLDEATNATRIQLYKNNQEMMAIMTLGQNSDHGMAAINKTKSADHPQGIAWKAWKNLKEANQPSDTAAEIALENELEGVKMINAKDYYKECISVTSKYTVQVDDKQHLKIMAKKATNTTICKMILDELIKATPNFEECCDEISKVQRLQKTKTNGEW